MIPEIPLIKDVVGVTPPLEQDNKMMDDMGIKLEAHSKRPALSTRVSQTKADTAIGYELIKGY